MALPNKQHYHSAEIARHFRYSVGFVYFIIREGKLKTERIRGHVRIPRAKIRNVACKCKEVEYA
jgi:hypothetical protein